MASRSLREITTTGTGNGTGLPFALRCFAWFLKELLGFTNYSESGNLLYSLSTGVNGSFTGTDFTFTDSVSAAFVAGDVNRWIVVKDSVDRNCGIFKILTRVSASVVTLDWRSGTKEFPTASTGVTWWVIEPGATAAGGSITCCDADDLSATVEPGEFALINDGQGINLDHPFNFYRQYKYVGGYPPGSDLNWAIYGFNSNSWRGGVVAANLFTRQNYLVGKTINLTFGDAGGAAVTFTGTNPLSITDVVDQINDALIATPFGEIVYESDALGYRRAGGGFLTFRTTYGSLLPGQPQFSAYNYLPAGGTNEGGPANNSMVCVYSGSDAWTELGLTGTSNLTAVAINPINRGYDNRDDPAHVPPRVPATGSAIATQLNTDINGMTGDLFSSSAALAVVTINNTQGGAHGNRTIGVLSGGNMSATGMSGGTSPAWGDYFRCKTPHAQGWEVEVSTSDPLAAPYLRVMVSANGAWDATGKILGPVYFGSVASAANWIYAEGDTDGEWLNFFTHQATANRYNGAVVGNLVPAESKADEEKVVLLGNNSSASAQYDGGIFGRTYDSYHIGHGYVWSQGDPRECWMIEPSYSGYANGWSKWTTRERNRRCSGGSTAGGGTGDNIAVAAGVVTLTDAAGLFVATDVGKRIRITGATNAVNNGSFIVTERLSATQIKFANALAVNETSSFTWSMDIQDVLDGTVLVVDPNNMSGWFELLGVAKGLKSVRGGAVGGWAVRKAFDQDGYLDLFHVQDGIAVGWGGVTAQH
jgi:hypothetical protein